MQNSINPFNIRPANRVNNISEYYFSKKLKEIAELNARGLDIISLGIGGPDRPPHPETIETLCTESRKSDVHGYQPYIGLPELRRAFADWYNRWYNVTLDPQKEIQPLIGSKEGILHISLAFLNAGDGVLVPNPGYPTYSSVSRLAEAEIFTYDLDENNHWRPDFKQLESLPLDRIKLMWVNYPNMPTGAKASMELFTKLVDFGKRHNIIIVNDNPYSFILNDNPMSILAVPGKALGCSYDPSQAGLFVWGKIPDSATDAESLADEILYNAHVFITPGFIFGSRGNRYIRISLCAPEKKMQEALHRIEKIKSNK